MLMYKKFDQNYLLRYPVYQGFFLAFGDWVRRRRFGVGSRSTSAFKPKPRAAKRASLKSENRAWKVSGNQDTV